MKRDKTVCEAIKIVLKDKPEGMTAEQIYKEIIDNNLYKFNARNPQTLTDMPAVRLISSRSWQS